MALSAGFASGGAAADSAATDPALWYQVGGKTDAFHTFPSDIDSQVLGDGTRDAVASQNPYYQQYSLPGQMTVDGKQFSGSYQIGGSYIDNGADSIWWITHRFFKPG